MNNDFDALREAVRVSPDNIPLRRVLAENLLQAGLADEAETEYRAVVNLDPSDQLSRFGLARCFYRSGSFDRAMVLIESLTTEPNPLPTSFQMLARLLRREGRIPEAVRAYRQAIQLDDKLADEELAEQLGITDDPEAFVEEGRVREAVDAGDGADMIAEIQRPQSSFAEVGGMEDLKETIRLKIIHPITNPDLYRAYGKQIGGGILLFGPPGCGKTHIARAVAGEINASFIAIGINDVLDMWIGSSERNLHQLFENARAHRPCVIFIDEVDALAASRSDMKQSSGRQVINQFLAELDGIDADNDGILVLAATNAPWHVDPAFRRPGRFDRVVFVPPPDRAARAEILRLHLKGKPTDDIDADAVAKKAEGFSGADLRNVIDMAIEDKLQEALKRGTVVPLTTKDLLKVIKKQKPTSKEWFSSARNHALYANQGGIYDDILDYLKMKRT